MSGVGELVDRTRTAVGWTADTDEIAAILESSGVNDRVAGRDYGYPSVFALAREVLTRFGSSAPPRSDRPHRTFPIGDTLVRSGLHLTPTALAIGAAPRLGALAWYATTGLLVAGWSWAQALACLGYRIANESGRHAAARPLAVGFAALATMWAAILTVNGAGLTASLVCAAQVALFAANTAALVAGTERPTLVAGLGCWVAAGGLLAGVVLPALLTLSVTLPAMVAVAYRPAWRKTAGWPARGWYPGAFRHGLVGAGQAVLFVVVALGHGDTFGTAVPLLVGVPMMELMLVWHQRRVADGRACLADRAAFRQHLSHVARGSGLALGLPLLGGAALAGRSPMAGTVLLAGLFALCLVLVAHRRPLSAALVVWWPAVLCAAHPASAAATLLCAYPPALALAVMAMRDPASYR